MSPALNPGAAPLSRRAVGDAVDRVRGTFTFAVDRRIEGTLHAVAVRSVAPHGRITSIDAADALAVPGVVAVIDGSHVAADDGISPWYGENRADQPVLAIGKVRYVGEPVALVIADSRATAEAAAAQVWVDIEELPHVVDPVLAGAPDAPQLHDEWPNNDSGTWTLVHGDAERAMATAAHVHTATYTSPAQNHVPMEPHSATGAWLPDGSLEVWTGTQSPYVVRQRLATMFRLDPDRVRVRGDSLGGAFGSKIDLRLEGLVALASRAVGAPVRMELRRDEVFQSASKHAATVTMTTGVDEDGLLVARIIDIVWNSGAYALQTPRSSRTGMIRSPGPYRIPHVLARSVARYTNTVPTGPFRGAMTGQVCWAHESAADEIAAELGVDPVEWRRRNLLRDGDAFATGDVMHEMHYVDLLTAVDDALTADAPPTSSTRTRTRRRGRGVAAVLKTTRTPTRSEAQVQVDAEGQVAVRTSAVEMGQGAAASLAEMAARRLDMPAEDVSVSWPDTGWTPFDQTTSSSRTTFATGLAVERAASDLRACIAQQVAQPWGITPDQVVHRDGCVSSPGDPAQRMTYADVVRSSGAGELVGTGRYETPPGAGRLDPETSQGNVSVHFHQGVVGVEVEVDTETGRVHVLRAHGATYAGRLIDAERARKQIEGGMLFGLGQAVMEETLYEAGQMINPNLSDYQIPSLLDVPLTSSTVLSDADPDAEPHGIGESTVPPMAPAVANAVHDAVGVRIRDLPVTAEKVLRALREKQADDRKN
ncbi:xanthine dehydrogenase family protein molybdopterin-binding subunit [Blastococcus saxobsidens]|uniref:CO/xanthine dehydrogenase Mo-binding subunit n=1 Tax=Blastococcus saxobsidens TaxID=138336 RepID=A0A4Q7Y9I1_9ACTN|nr:xanthine dehydrogenase family protein molybdopterin-binding subunit [Blastococcus saxobsidens]RZU33458.1 CO/xanthine dehydrogenase Mo-binding subunit [Blastococcus saxobsidens]